MREDDKEVEEADRNTVCKPFKKSISKKPQSVKDPTKIQFDWPNTHMSIYIHKIKIYYE